MKRAAIIGLWLAGLGCLGLLWWRAARAPTPAGSRGAARAVADRLEAHVEERAALVRELAERFGAWEALPEAALGDALRSASMRHAGLGMVLVADPAGRVLAGYDPGRRLADERVAAGSLDPVLSRREALGRGDAVQVLASAHAGVLQSLELVAPIRRADGSRPGYVGATLRLEPLRLLLGEHRLAGLWLRVATSEGHLLYPCAGRTTGRGPTQRTTRFQVWVEPAPGDRTWDLVVALLVTFLLSAALLLATRVVTRLDRPQRIGKSGPEPILRAASPSGQTEQDGRHRHPQSDGKDGGA